jgi:hypothetical protein
VPVIELAKYELIGLIGFSSKEAGQLGAEAIKKVMDNLQGAQLNLINQHCFSPSFSIL